MVPTGRPAPHPIAHRPHQGTAGILSLEAHEITRVAGDTFGPYLATNSTHRIAVWAVMDGTQRALYSVAIDRNGAPRSQPVRLGEVAANLELAALRRRIGTDGFVFVSSSDSGAVDAWLLGADGQLEHGPIRAGQANDSVYWIDAVRTSKATIVFWTARRGDRADVFASAVTPEGKAGATSEVVRDAKAWQVAEVGDGIAIAVVRPTLAKSEPGPIDLVFTDADGRPRTKPVSVLASASGALDLDLVAVEERAVVAWTDMRGIEGRVFTAAVARDGTIAHPAAPATEPFGEQALVRLVPPIEPSKPAYLVWEQTLERPTSGRLLRVAAVSSDGSLRPERGTLVASSDAEQPLEFRASPHGVAMLTSAPLCRRGATCEGATSTATYAELDGKLAALASEPLRLSDLGGAATALAWDLSCGADGCAAIAASSGSPTPMHAVALEHRSDSWALAADRAPVPPPPRAHGIETIGDSEPLSDVSATSLGAGKLVAWLSYSDPAAPSVRLKTPAADGRFDSLHSLLAVRAVASNGADAPPQTISLRARSLGGVTLAPDAEVGDALLAWTALDDGKPQVFVTIVGRDGKKIQQRMLTRAPGEKSDVAVAFATDGWLVTWVDERNQSQEVFVAKVNRALTTVVPEHALTLAPSAATEPALLVRGKQALIAWADARDSKKPGWASINFVQIGVLDGKPVGKPSTLYASDLHQFAPVLASFGDATAIAWIEGDPKALPGSANGGIRIGRLDASGQFVEPPVFVQVAGRTFTSLALTCDAERCRLVASAAGQRGELMAFEFMPGHRPTPSRLVGLIGPSLASAYPAFAGDDLYYADQSSDARGRVRRMLIDWH